MRKSDDDIALMVFGGLIGAALASPKLEEKQVDYKYRKEE